MRTTQETTNGTMCLPRGKGGAALVIVMCFAGILLGAGVALTWVTGNSAFKVRKIRDGMQAWSCAEAGVGAMLMLREQTNYSYWKTCSITGAIAGGGTYVASNSVAGGNILITSVGRTSKDTRTTILEVLQNLDFNGALVAGGNIYLDSSAVTINGDIHSNGSVTNKSGNPQVNGNVSACGGVDGFTPTGTVSEGASAMEIPPDSVADKHVDDLNYWRDKATDPNYYKTNSWSTSADLRPTSGVVYVVGNLTISGGSVVGTIVATGNININNSFAQTRTNDWPAMIAGINIDVDNRNNYDGVIYAGGNVSIKNNRNFNNCMIIAEGTIDVKCRGTVYGPTNSTDVTPPLELGGWQK